MVDVWRECWNKVVVVYGPEEGTHLASDRVWQRWAVHVGLAAGAVAPEGATDRVAVHHVAVHAEPGLAPGRKEAVS